MKKFSVLLAAGLLLLGMGNPAFSYTVNLYVDAAPNVYGSPDYAGWQANAFATAVDGSFVNMASSINPCNVGTTNFDIEDEVVYSFGDLGRRLTWIYWVPDATIAELTGKFEISVFNYWDGEELDFYDYYYGSTWQIPTKWEEYAGGVIGTAGMAWWGAYGVNTQEALDADLAAWGSVDEDWIFTARLDGQEYSITSYRDAAPVPEPSTFLLFGAGLVGLAFPAIRKRLK